MKGQQQLGFSKGLPRKEALISPCGLFRYYLVRRWDDDHGELRWCMLNPSVADADTDDPTVRKCTGFAKRWGFGSIRIVNLFAFRATNPRDLLKANDPVGPDNAQHLEEILRTPVVVAWGGSLPKSMIAREIVKSVTRLAERNVPTPTNPWAWWCLGRTKGGEPRHPLMLSYDTAREPWPGEPS